MVCDEEKRVDVPLSTGGKVILSVKLDSEDYPEIQAPVAGSSGIVSALPWQADRRTSSDGKVLTTGKRAF